nr:lysoplasmalogenase family protein [uncultured Flavobacterium sp.]
MSNKYSLILYFVAGLAFMLGVVLNNSELMLVSKPIIAPAIFFYYLQEKHEKFDWSYTAIITLFFIGDMIVLIELPNAFLAIVTTFLIAYLFFLKGIIDDLVVNRFRSLNRMQFFSILVAAFFLLYLLITSLDILIEAKTENMWVLVLYGIILLFIGVISSLNYIFHPSRYMTFMLLTAVCFIISDLFYLLKNDFLEIEIFSYVNNSTQVLSYFFLTQYYILKRTR